MLILLIDFVGWVLVWMCTIGAYEIAFSVEINGTPHRYVVLPQLW